MDKIRQPLASETQLVDSLCPVELAAQIVGQKWTLQIVNKLMARPSRRFCEIQEELGGVNPGTLSSRLKMLEEEGIIRRVQVSAIPPHVEYSLTPMGAELHDVLRAVTKWSKRWLCTDDRRQSNLARSRELVGTEQFDCVPGLNS
jgi:DNA-binding HxlR family transcriptional regulator